MRLFYGFGLSPLLSVKGNPKASAYQDNLDNGFGHDVMQTYAMKVVQDNDLYTQPGLNVI